VPRDVYFKVLYVICEMNLQILDNTLKHANMKSLKNFRLVCKAWNDIVVRMWSKRHKGFGPAIVLSHSSESCQILETDRVNEQENASKILSSASRTNSNKMESKRIEDLHEVWASAAEGLFRTAHLNDACLNNAEFQRAFVDHGYKLKSVKVKSYYLRTHILKNILIKWCPNLEELDFNYLQLDKNIPSVNSLSELHNTNTTLNLTSLSVYMNLSNRNEEDEPIVVDILGDIIIASPKMKTINCKGLAAGFTDKLLHKLQSYPSITRNFESLTLSGNRTLEALNRLELSDKLKVLIISQPFPRADLMQLLLNVKRSLEKLTLSCIDEDETGRWNIGPVFELPRMDNLTELKFLAYIYSSNAIDFLGNAPNLKKVFLSGVSAYHLTRHCQSMQGKPQKSLTTLHLYSLLSEPSVLNMVNLTFPNLSKLLIFLTTSSTSYEAVKDRHYYYTALEAISKMENVSDLFINLSCHQMLVLGTENLYAWTKAFSFLKKMPS